jgi:hypothetical protein
VPRNCSTAPTRDVTSAAELPMPVLATCTLPPGSTDHAQPGRSGLIAQNEWCALHFLQTWPSD